MRYSPTTLWIILSILLSTQLLQAKTYTFAPDDSPDSWRLTAGGMIPAAEMASLKPRQNGGLELSVGFPEGADFAGIEHTVQFDKETREIHFKASSEKAFQGIVALIDSQGETFLARYQGKSGTSTYKFPLDNKTFSQHWGGDKNGNIDYPVTLFKTAINARGTTRGKVTFTSFCKEVANDVKESKWDIQINPDLPSGIAWAGFGKNEINLILINKTAEPNQAQVKVFHQASGERGQEHQLAVETTSFGKQRVSIPADLTRTGYHTVEIQLADNDISKQWKFAVAVVEKPSDPIKSFKDRFYGLCEMEDLEAARRIGAQFIRKLIHWNSIEPKKDHFYLKETVSLLDEAHHNKLGVILTAVVRFAPQWTGFKDSRDLNTEPGKAYYQKFLKKLAEIAAQRRAETAIEIQNEPDIALLYLQKLDHAAAVKTAASLIRSGANAVREIDKTIPVIGMGVSGMDFRQDLSLSRNALPLADQELDHLSPHPYTQKRFAGHSTLESPTEYGFQAYLSKAGRLSKEYTRGQALWITELGWGLSEAAPIQSEEAKTHAAIVAKIMTLAKATQGVDKFTWFTGQSAWREKGHDFSLFRKLNGTWYPLPSACAYATVSHLLENAKFNGTYEDDDSVYGLQFDSPNTPQTITALWASEKAHSPSLKILKHVTHVDIMGVKTELQEGSTIKLSDVPVFLIAPKPVSKSPFHELFKVLPPQISR